MAITGKVVKLVHIYSSSFVCHNLENNNLKLQTNPAVVDSTNISHKSRKTKIIIIIFSRYLHKEVKKECTHYNKAAQIIFFIKNTLYHYIHDCNASGLHYLRKI